MNTQHVTVIGAGIVGISAARYLQQAGFSVTVVDRLPPGEATSFGNACVITDSSVVPIPGPGIIKSGLKMLLSRDGPLFIRPEYLTKISPWLYRFVRQGRLDKVEHTVRSLTALLHGALAEHQRLARGTPAENWIGTDPTLYAYESEQQFRNEAFGWQLRQKYAIPFETIDGATLHDLEPALAAKYRFGVKMSGHGKALNPSKLVKAHAGYFAAQGGVILQREIRTIEVRDNRPTRLITDQEALPLDKLLIAAGPWSARLSQQLGSPVPLESEGGYHLTLPDPGLELTHPVMETKSKIAITHMEQGLRIGGLVEFAGIESDPDFARSEVLLKSLRSILPRVNSTGYSEWRGHRPTIVDSLPVISQSPHFDNVYYAFGHQHVGLSSGPKTGRLISELIAGQEPGIDLSPFRIDRF